MNASWRVLLAAALLLAACGSEEPSADAARGAAPDSAPVAAAAAPATVDTAQPAGANPKIVLAPDGLQVTGGAAPGLIAFGGPQARVLAEAGAVLGAPRNGGMQEECPAGPLYQTTFGAVQLVFQDSAFVGWATQPDSPLRTAEGIGPGSTLSQVRAAYPAATVDQTSLGTEFAAGDLYGVFSDSTTSSELEIMFAGINCIFR
ncbi:hypothetical protein [Longimicrobium sp.]|jgi:hypothetical protein|uniref:hypothetical protein n=1 Tax=Longimicrobium sp. TaxID=2029185 RepID=UPI002ED9E1B1